MTQANFSDEPKDSLDAKNADKNVQVLQPLKCQGKSIIVSVTSVA
ncbi:MAG: hypothetical protein ACM3UY_10700 [Methanocella sp.]|jgi:ABC-type Mn2+/Zn2+ transport system ATPase subunit